MNSNVPEYTHTIPTVFASLANPYHLLDVPNIRTFINCYCDSDATVEALAEKLLGRSAFTGVNPVDPFCGRGDTRG